MYIKLPSYAGLFLLSITLNINVHAAGDMTKQSEISMTITLGNVNNSLRFYPDKLRFETGKLYKLILINPSQQKHYFSAEGFARSIFTRKVQVISNKGKTIAEVKGHINEIEVYPGGKSEWWFIPIKSLESSTLHCSIKGHSEAGMQGFITIK